MDRVDLTLAALEALQPSTLTKSKAKNRDEARRVRGKLLGVLIRKYRLEAERSPIECAKFMCAEPALIEDWEFGDSEPSLPQLEMLAQFLNGRESPMDGDGLPEERARQDEYLLLRRRLIGAMLRAARESRGISVEELSDSAGLDALQLQRFEFGEEAIPVSNLTALAESLQIDMRYFALPTPQMPEPSRSSSLPQTPAAIGADWREFATERDNLPFIRLAMAFQHIARDDLHRIADALFAIIRANGDPQGWSGSPT